MVRLTSVFGECFRGKMTGARGALHSRWPAGCNPVARKKAVGPGSRIAYARAIHRLLAARRKVARTFLYQGGLFEIGSRDSGEKTRPIQFTQWLVQSPLRGSWQQKLRDALTTNSK